MQFNLSVAAVLLMATVSSAESALVTYNYTGPTRSIPDSNSAGVNFDINVTDTFDLLSFQSVSVTGTHAWVGDLVIRLTHLPTGTSIDLINRPGKTTTSIFGSQSAVFGDSSNLSGTYTFANSTTRRIIDAAAQGGNNSTVSPGVYAPTSNTFNGNSSSHSGEVIQNLTNTFSPISNMSGIWRLNVADLAGADFGSISGFSFTVDAAAVPEPSSLLLFGGAVLTGSGWHLRRKRWHHREPDSTSVRDRPA